MASPDLPLRSVAALSAAGAGPAALLDAALDARPLGRPVERYDVEKLRTRTAALLPPALDAAIAARWPGLDRAVALCLEVVLQATGGAPVAPRTALVVGTSLGCTASWEPWHRALVEGRSLPAPPVGAAHGDVAWQVAERLGLRGPWCTISTACTSGAQALLVAADMLRLGEADEALVVAVDGLSPFVHAGFDALRALSPDERRPAPFGPGRAGLWLGEGAACVWLSRGGGRVASLLGGAAAGDGFHMTAPEPSGRGLASAIRGALAEANLDPAAVVWLSAHGTGTIQNDAMEARAFREIFGDSIPPIHCLKPVLGHTLGASGLLEVVLICEALRRGIRPPCVSAEVDPELAPLPLCASAEVLVEGPILSVNSAFAGHNTALLLGAP